jgi:myosin heavy subunit
MQNTNKKLLLVSLITVLITNNHHCFSMDTAPKINPIVADVDPQKKLRHRDLLKQSEEEKNQLTIQLKQKEEELENQKIIYQKLNVDQDDLTKKLDKRTEAEQELKKKLQQREDEIQQKNENYHHNLKSQAQSIEDLKKQTNAAQLEKEELKRFAAQKEADLKTKAKMYRDARQVQNITYSLPNAQFPENMTKAQAALFNAQANEHEKKTQLYEEQIKATEYANSWTKSGIDTAGAITNTLTTNLVCPILVNGLSPLLEDWLIKQGIETRQQILQHATATANKDYTLANKLLAEEQIESSKRNDQRQNGMLLMQERTALVNQFRTMCDGSGTPACKDMYASLSAMLIKTIDKLEKA